jgi:hypothetical protein
VKDGRGRAKRRILVSPGVTVLPLMKETTDRWETVDQRRPRKKSELDKEEEGPGSTAIKLFRVIAPCIRELLWGGEGGDWWGIQRLTMNLFWE